MGAAREIERPEIRTERLHLRPFHAADADRLVAFLNDFEVSRTLGRVPYPYTKEHAVDWLDRQQMPCPADETGFVIDRGDGLIGGIGFRLIDSTPDIGYWLARSCWGQGLMTEAARAALAWLFAETDHAKVRSGVYEGNPASLRIQEKLGFEVTGRSTVHCLAQGRDLPHIDTQITRTRFEALDR